MAVYKILLDKISAHEDLINSWFKEKFSKNPPLFYNSVDVRHSGFKVAPIDTNCFPAGFNHLNSDSRKIAEIAAEEFLAKNFPDVKKILIIPESHTRNLKYLSNVLALKEIISKNAEVELGTLITEIENSLTIDLEDGRNITLQKLVKSEDKIITTNGFEADLIISNNDFTDGVAEILLGIKQPIIPSTNLGWYQRTKSNHFAIYNNLAGELCGLIGIDPWLISTFFDSCDEINFKEKVGTPCLESQVEEQLKKIKDKYLEHNIDSEPYCFIKAESGTYGLAMMTVKSPKDIAEINKKERNKMNMLKGNIQNTKVIIQEGVVTGDKIKNIIAEPMIYLINGKVVGNLFRTNQNRDESISLNAAGMEFCDLNDLQDEEIDLGLKKDQVIKIYSLIARLAALAAAMEKY